MDVAHLLKWDMPVRSNDGREFDTADALFAREVLKPPMEPAKGLAMPVASAKCRLGGRPLVDADFLLGDLGDKGRPERAERMDTSYSPLVLACVLGITGGERRKIKASEECACVRAYLKRSGAIHLKSDDTRDCLAPAEYKGLFKALALSQGVP